MATTKTKKKSLKVETQDQLLKLMRALIPTAKWTVNVDCYQSTSLRVRGVNRRMTISYTASMYWHLPAEHGGIMMVHSFQKSLTDCWDDFRKKFIEEVQNRCRNRQLDYQVSPKLAASPAKRVLYLEHHSCDV